MGAIAAVLSGLGGLLALGGWLVVVVSSVRLVLHHRAEGQSIGHYAVRGHLFFSAGNFAPSGAPVVRQLGMGAGVFAAGWVVTALGVAIGTQA